MNNLRKGIFLQHNREDIEKKENKINLLNSIFELSFKILPFVLGFFIFLDINLFINTFNFKLGLINLIFSNLNFSNINLLFILTIIPFLLSIIVILPIFVITYLKNIIRRTKPFLRFFFRNKICAFILYGLFLFFIFFIFSYFIKYAFDKYNDLFFIFILIILLSSIYTLTMKIFHINKYYSEIIGFSILITIILSMYSYNDIFFMISVFTFILVMFFNMIDIKKNKKNESKNQKNLILKIITVFLLMLLILYIYFNNINSDSWKKLEEEKVGINYLTFNLIFNKGLLLKNNSTINVDFEKKYYEKESAILSFKDNNNFEIDNNYLYLQLTNNIKLFVKNLKTENKIVFLLIEEKITHEAISKYSLIDMSIINKN